MSADYVCQMLWAKVYVLQKKIALVKAGASAWYSVKIRVIFDVQFERQKVDEKANLHKNRNMQTLF